MRSKKALYNITTNLILQIVAVAYGFIIPKIIINNFGSNVNGLIASITQFLGYIVLLESGFGPVIRSCLYKPIAKKDKKEIENILRASEKIFKKIAIIFVIYITILSITYPFIINKEFDYLYIVLLIITISINTFSEYFFGMTYKLFLKSKQQTYVISIIQIITYILCIIITLITASFCSSVHVIKLIGCVIFALRPILQSIYVKKKYKLNLKNADNSYSIKNKWDGLAQHIAAIIHENTDITILTFFCKLSDVSIYSVYYMVVKGIKSVLQSFTMGIESSFGDMIARNEIDNLNHKFNIYEIIFLSISTIICVTAGLLITPFVSVYTIGIIDVNYVKYCFGYLMIISEFINALRDPYITLAYAAGHFKETKKGAWIEALINILISIICVKRYGLVGVAIGTIVAMTVRTLEFVYHSNKYILKRSILISIKKIIIIIIESIIIIIISKFLPLLNNISYINWIINAVMIGLLSMFVVIFINMIIYKKEFKEIIKILRNILKKRKKV